MGVPMVRQRDEDDAGSEARAARREERRRARGEREERGKRRHRDRGDPEAEAARRERKAARREKSEKSERRRSSSGQLSGAEALRAAVRAATKKREAEAAAEAARTPPPAAKPASFSAVRTPSTAMGRKGLDRSPAALAGRQARFGADALAASPVTVPSTAELVRRPPQLKANLEGSTPVRGTSTDLDKAYFRLTAAPDASAVRPPEVLVAAFERVKQRWRSGEADYAATCEGLKSIRQDLTVQHVRDELTAAVYETHARVALEARDVPSFLQCAAACKALHEDGVVGGPKAKAEFAAYRVLFAACAGSDGGAGGDAAAAGTGGGFAQAQREAGALPPKVLRSRPVRHALRTAGALARGDFRAFFAAYEDAPRMAAYVLDTAAQKMRRHALASLLAAYRAPLPLADVAAWLGFEYTDGDESGGRAGQVVDAARAWLEEQGCVMRGAALDVAACRAAQV